jgi:hypothetical protein
VGLWAAKIRSAEWKLWNKRPQNFDLKTWIAEKKLSVQLAVQLQYTQLNNRENLVCGLHSKKKLYNPFIKRIQYIEKPWAKDKSYTQLPPNPFATADEGQDYTHVAASK